MSEVEPGALWEVSRAERKAVSLFLGCAIVAGVVVAGITVAKWGGGILDNRVEPLFWAGAILGGLSRAGVLLFLIAPTLCIVAIFWDYWI
jgi:hypothetical protein